MAISDDFAIDYVNKRIYSTGSTIYTVNQLYSWLMDTFDEQGAMDDTIPISAQTPTEYTMENEWFIDDTSTQFLKTGAIKTSGYNGKIQTLTLAASGYTNCVAGDIGKQVRDDAVEIGPLLAYNNTTRKWWIRSASTVANASAMTITAGTGAGTASGASVTGEDLYANIYTLGTIESGTRIYVYQAGSKISPDWWSDGHIDILIKVKEAGTEINNAVITIYARVWSDLYDNYEIDLTAGGRNAVPLATSNDLDNQSAMGAVGEYIDKIDLNFVHAVLGYSGQTGDAAAEGECLWQTGSAVSGSAFVLKYSTSPAEITLGNVTGSFGSPHSIYILSKLKFSNRSGSFIQNTWITGSSSLASGSIRRWEYVWTGSIGYLHLSNVAGTFTNGERLSGSGNVGAIVSGSIDPSTFTAVAGTLTSGSAMNKTLGGTSAPYNVIIDCNGETVAKLYELSKLITARTSDYQFYPVSGSTIEVRSGEDYQVASGSGTTYVAKKASPLGTFAGGKFFGARGVWIEDMNAADVQKYSLIDAGGTVRDPPNLQSFVVDSLVSGDKVLIALSAGVGSTTINKSQYSNAAQATGQTYVEVQEAIPDDTPETGVIRVRYNVGASNEAEDVYTVTSLNKPSKRFNISGTTARAYTTADRSYVPYMDLTADATSESVTVTYGTDRNVVTRVRKYGGAGNSIIPFQIAGTFVSTGYKVSAIRTADSIVN